MRRLAGRGGFPPYYGVPNTRAVIKLNPAEASVTVEEVLVVQHLVVHLFRDCCARAPSAIIAGSVAFGEHSLRAQNCTIFPRAHGPSTPHFIETVAIS